MKKVLLLLVAVISIQKLASQSSKFNAPIVSKDVVFEEKKGFVAVEAEYFYKQTKSEIREWFRTSKNETPSIGRDDDEQHCYGASNNAYLEILPDERVTHADELKPNDNFSNVPGKMAVVHYKVKFNTTGRYYVWVRAFSTGGEDNGIHVGVDNTWPEHGKRMQWCKGKNRWTWESKQRTKKVHCGVAKEVYLDITSPGIHDIQFSMREDGFEFDKFVLTTDANYVPLKTGRKSVVATGVLPAPFPKVKKPAPKIPYIKTVTASVAENKVIYAQEFLTDGTTNFYKNGKNWLVLNPKKSKDAETSIVFKYKTGNYDVVFVGAGESNGVSIFSFLVDKKEVGNFKLPATNKILEQGENFNALWQNIKIKKGDKIKIKAKATSAGHKYARARWEGIVFVPVGKGKHVKNIPLSK